MAQTFLDKLYEVINSNISDPGFGVKELTREMGISYTNLLRKVRSQTGKSSNQIIREIRLTKALEILQTEEVNVSQVAYRLGFNSPSYFTTCFRKHFGYSPGELEVQRNASLNGHSKEPGKKYPATRFLIISVLFSVFIVTAIIISRASIERFRHSKSIAVMPFDLMFDEGDKKYLAKGMKDAIVQELSKISELRVIPSTTTEQYINTTKTLKAIGQEMNVRYISEGSFWKDEDSVSIKIRLYDIDKERWILEQNYNKEWKRIFSVHNDVAQEIAGKIKVAITPADLKRLQAEPTQDMNAYESYLKGQDYLKRGFSDKDIRYAIIMFEKAVEIDPDYALAWMGLSACYRKMYWMALDLSKETRSQAKSHLDKALALSPDDKEILIEESRYYYHCQRDYSKSLELLENLKLDFPNDSEIYFWIGAVSRRLGEFRKTMEQVDKAIELNPSQWNYWSTKAETARSLGDYLQAETLMNKALSLNPSYQAGYSFLCYNYIGSGQIKKATRYLFDNKDFIVSRTFKQLHALLESIAGNYDIAIEWTKSMAEDPISYQMRYSTKNLDLGLIYRLIPDPTMANFYFSRERDFLLNKIKETGGDLRLFQTLGTAYAGLGMKEEAIDAARKALEKSNIALDPYGGYIAELEVVRILVMVGEYEDALDKLDLIMSKNAVFSSEYFAQDPFWDPVRNHPKFIEIINNPKYKSDLAD